MLFAMAVGCFAWLFEFIAFWLEWRCGGLWFSVLLLCWLCMWIGLGWLCFVADGYFFSFSLIVLVYAVLCCMICSWFFVCDFVVCW